MLTDMSTDANKPSQDLSAPGDSQFSQDTSFGQDNLLDPDLPGEQICCARVSAQEWQNTSSRLEDLLRPYILRYGKATPADMRKMVLDAAQKDLHERDYCYQKGIIKIQSNTSTWKNKTIEALLDYIQRAISSNLFGLMETESNPRKLFKAFCRRYNHHDAKAVFPWASKTFKFDEPLRQKEMAKGPLWIKAYFINLAVKAKMHLDAPRAEGTDHQSLLDYYDLYPRLPRYQYIKPCHFKKKPSRLKWGRKWTGAPVIEEFADVEDIARAGEGQDVEEDGNGNGDASRENWLVSD